MYTGIKFNQAAFKHGATKADILRAFDTFIYENQIEYEEDDNKHLLLGFNCTGNLIEIMYNKIDEDNINIFHAMPCRKVFLKLIDE
jgi:hypothetical protein